MPAPSLDITIGDRGPATPRPGDVSALFAVAITDKGPVGTITECFSLGAVKDAYGDIIAASHLIRSAEAFFREGGRRMVISRAVGLAPVTATLALSSAAPAVVLNVAGLSPGDHANKYAITVTTTTGSNRTVVLEHDTDGVLSTGTYASTAALVADLEATGRVITSLGVGTWPLANLAKTHLAGGTDDHASITQTQWNTALALVPDDFDGSIAAPGITTPAMHAALTAYFWSHKLWPLCDSIDTATVASLTAPAATLRALDADVALGTTLAPWVKVPLPAGGTITIPPSGAYAGRLAKADTENEAGPAQPPAASYGIFDWVQDVTQEWTSAQRDTLADAGVLVIRNVRGKIQPFDDCTIADPATWPQYETVGACRVVLAIHSECRAALAPYVLRLIDGNGHLLAEIQKDLVAIGQAWYTRGALFGATAAEAFSVDVQLDPDNPRKINAYLTIRPSKTAKTVTLLITTVATSDTI